MVLSAPVLAENSSYGPPVSACLNKYTIPQIKTDRPAIEVVDEAYGKCGDVLAQWNRERESLPVEMVAKQNDELHEFYVHMIEVRRKAEAAKK
jgi:hypothetical protein